MWGEGREESVSFSALVLIFLSPASHQNNEMQMMKEQINLHFISFLLLQPSLIYLNRLEDQKK